MQVSNNGESFSNVYLFVADALRFDSVPSAVSEYGNVVKTVSSGLRTPEAFGTILTGRYPPQHAVQGFKTPLQAPVPSLLDVTSGRTPFYRAPYQFREPELNVQAKDDHDEWIDILSEVEDPFVAIDRDLYPHAPYNQEAQGTGQFETTQEYWTARKGDIELVRDEYDKGIETMMDRFEEKLSLLDERGLLDDTLVVFTADHGELLGEHGFVGHGKWTCPELVYVPTIFCNDEVTASGDIMGHVDLFPTICSLLDHPLPDDEHRAGRDLTSGAPDDRMLFNENLRKHAESSVWDANGGHVFSNRSLLDGLIYWGGLLTISGSAPFIRRRPLQPLKSFSQGDRTMGDPEFDFADAEKFAESVMGNRLSPEEMELDLETKQRLEALGYAEDL